MTTQLTRAERRKEERTLKQEGVNQQYSYTTRESIATFKDLRGNFNWLPSKEGQSILQQWISRILQQRTASNLTKATPLGCFGVHDNDDFPAKNYSFAKGVRDFEGDEFFSNFFEKLMLTGLRILFLKICHRSSESHFLQTLDEVRKNFFFLLQMLNTFVQI